MAGRVYVNTAYSLGQAGLSTMAQLPIVANRAPNTSDQAPIGTLWIFRTSNLAYILTSVVNNSATWLLLEVGGGAGVFASLTVTPGPISLTGTTSINITGAGVTTINTGGTGALNLGNATGNTAVTGSLSTTTSLSATTTVTGGTGVTATTGNVVATAGQVNAGTTMTAGTGITATTGNIVATAGQVNAGTSMTAGTGITATTGGVTASAGDIVATLGNITAAVAATSKISGGTLYATGDAGGVAGTTSLTNVADNAQSTGALTILSKTANPGTNTGFLKIYVGSVVCYLPYWNNIAP